MFLPTGVPKKHSMPKRSPPNPPSSQESEVYHIKSAQQDLKKGGAIGSFWTTEHAKGANQNVPSSDQPAKQAVPKHNQNNVASKGSPPTERHVHLHQSGKSEQGEVANFFDHKHSSQTKVASF